MNNFKLKLRSFFKDELFTNNRTAAYAKNKKILRTIIIGCICAYLVLIIASFMSQAYVPARPSYIIGVIIFSLVLISLRFLSAKASTTLAYIIHFAFVAYCIYNSAIVWPGDICVMILAEIFIVSTLILDKSWRVFGTTIISGIIYLAVISRFKTPYHFVDEYVNIVCFTILSCIVGTFTRKTQLENFDAMEKLRISEEHYKLAMKHSSGVICEYVVADKCVTMSKEVAEIFEVPQKYYNVPYESVKNGAIRLESCKAYIEFYEGILNGNKTGTAEFERKTINGWRWQRATYSVIFADNDKPLSAVISVADITEQKNEHNKLQDKAAKDGMTDVYNRITAEALIKQELKYKDKSFAFLIADIDNLKTINDTLGHPCGDKAIISLADELKKRSRKDDIVGRIGGDEFIAYLSGIENESQIEDKLGKLLSSLNAIYLDDKKTYKLSASIGVVLAASGDISFEELYSKADKALYIAKQSGRNNYSFYKTN